MVRRFIDYPRAHREGVRRWIPSWKLVLGSGFLAGILGAIALAALVAATPIPAPNDIAMANATVVYYADGKKEVGRIGEFNRVEVPLAAIPIVMQQAVLAAEDRTFYEHSGFSISGIFRAVVNNVSGGSSQGASTITQQFTKNAYLTSERSWQRKLKELVLSIKLETSSSKDEILSNYLNTVYFGRGAYGVQAAARAYFSTDISNIDHRQAAMLAALLKAPEGFAPEENLPRLKERYRYVIAGMKELGWLTPEQQANDKFPEYREKETGNRLSGAKGYILQEVKKALYTLGYDDASLGVAGLSVVTTIDKQAQTAATKAVKAEGPETGTEGLRIGLAAVRPGTGEIVAMYGGPDYVEEPLNNATQAIAQAGSTFKPFALMAAVEAGYSLDTLLPGKNGKVINGYKVNNYSKNSYSEVSLLQATQWSINTAYVQITADVGIDAVMDVAFRAGIPEDAVGVDRNLTFVLGTASPHTLDVANAYATFAANGVYAKPFLIKSVTAPNGGLIYEGVPQTSAVFSQESAQMVNYALRQVVTNGTGYAALAAGRQVAGKTGTTDENKSAWFAGYSPDLAAAVMMSKEDENGNPISLSGTGGMSSVAGGSFPARIFTAFLRAALEGVPETTFTRPAVVPTISQSPGKPTPSVTATPTDTAFPSGSPTPTDGVTPTDGSSSTATPEPTSTG